MELYLNLPIKAGMVLVLTDRTNTYKQLQPTKFRFFPNEPIEVPDKIGKRFLKEKKRTLDDGSEVSFVSKEPYAGDWPVELTEPPRMRRRRTRAGQLRPGGDPGTHIGRRLPANIGRGNTQVAVEAETDLTIDDDQKGDPGVELKNDGDERFTRVPRDDRLAGLKLRSLATKDFSAMKPGPVGLAVKTLGFKLKDGLKLSERQQALEAMCEIVSKEVKFPGI